MSIVQLLRGHYIPQAMGYKGSHFSLYFSREYAERWLLKWSFPSGHRVNERRVYYKYLLAIMDTDTYEFVDLKPYELYPDWFKEYELADEMSFEDYMNYLECTNK